MNAESVQPSEGSAGATPSKNPEQAMKYFGSFDKETGEKDEKKYYYLVPAASSINPPQYFRQVNPFQSIPSVRPLFPSPANPLEPKMNYVLQPVSLRADFKDPNEKQPQPQQAEMNAKTVFMLTPVARSGSDAAIPAQSELQSQLQSQLQLQLQPQPLEKLSSVGGSITIRGLQYRSGLENAQQAQSTLVQAAPLQSAPLQPVPMASIQQRLAEPSSDENEKERQPEGSILNLGNNVILLPKGNELRLDLGQAGQSLRAEPNQNEEQRRNEEQLRNNEPNRNVEQGRAEENRSQDQRQEGQRSDEQRQEEQRRVEPNRNEEQGRAEPNEEKKPDEDNRKKSDASIAQAKPNGLSLAGPGGVASSSPRGTALVGKDGLALSSPTGTAIAGDFGSFGGGLLASSGSQ